MKVKEMRFSVPEDLYDRYKIVCIELHLSVPRQTAELIKYFVEIQRDNLEKIKKSKEDYEKKSKGGR